MNFLHNLKDILIVMGFVVLMTGTCAYIYYSELYLYLLLIPVLFFSIDLVKDFYAWLLRVKDRWGKG
jgi:hypothetical protein